MPELEVFSTNPDPTRQPPRDRAGPSGACVDGIRFAQTATPIAACRLTMANTTGWEMLCPMGFTAEWNGGLQPGTTSPSRLHRPAPGLP